MTTEKKSDKTPAPKVNDNKAVFGPLGTYAVVAVIMVSMIVTTAIMLDSELNTVETEMTEVNAIDPSTIYTVVNYEPAAITTVTPETDAAETTETANTETAPVPVPVAVAEHVTQTASAEVPVAIEETAVTAPETEQVTAVTAPETEQVTTAKIVKSATPVQTRQAQIAEDNQDRIEAYKLEQKQHMAEMFARIRTLESQRLDKYKASQDEQIARLREQVTMQQQMIDKLALRNKELFEMRAANVQKNQTKREEALNRI